MTPTQGIFQALLHQCLVSRDSDWPAVGLYLQQEPALLESVTDGYWTALSIAAYCGGEQGRMVIKELLASGVSPDFRPEGQGLIPLLAAAQFNNDSTMRLLLEYGANPDSRTENGMTALHFPILTMSSEEKAAGIKNRAETLKMLLVKQANPNLLDTNGNSPLHYAYGRIFVFQHFLEKARLKELRFQKVRPPLKDRDGRPIIPEAILVYEDSLKAMAGVVDLLLEYGADPFLKNIYDRTPPECADFGLGRDEDDSLWTWRAWSPPVLMDEIDLSPSLKGLDRHRPADPELAACLDLIPEKWLNPPASQAELSELDLAFGCKLPQAMAELYRHHAGQREDIHSMPRRLMPPAKVLETFRELSGQDRPEGDLIWNDGQTTGLFWDSGEALDAAGVFLDGPLAGKIYLREAYESVIPRPDFRSLGSFYRWQTAVLQAEDLEVAESGRLLQADYPSLSPATDDPADSELSKSLFKQWEAGGHRDENLALYAVRLSAYRDTAELVWLLLSISLQPEHYGIVLDIVDLIIKRNYREAADQLYQSAQNPETRAAATKALMELLNLPEARQARNKLREMFG